MLEMCKSCTYYSEEACLKDIKPSLCTIRTRKGCYVNLEDSNITYTSPFGITYKFKSETQKNKYMKMIEYRLARLNAIEGSVFRYTDCDTKTFDLTNLVMLCYEKTYKESINNGNKNNKKAKG